MRILIAEDDAVLADGLSRSLKAGGYAVDVVESGDAADSALTAQSFDLLILDVGLPKLSGLEVLRRLRARNSTVPVLILTAADSVEQRVKGLDLGADDYMAKPFALSELEARARALTRRAAGGAQTILRHGPLALDQVGAYYRVHGRNSFALSGPTLDLDHVRQMIAYSDITQKHIRRFARELGAHTVHVAGDVTGYSRVRREVRSVTRHGPAQTSERHDHGGS